MSAVEHEIELSASATDLALVQAISKAELDQAITTAHAFPRSVKQFMDDCMELATLNAEIADDCIYALPRREKDKATGKWITKNIEGPSARLAEIVLHSWGNCRGGARVVNEGREFVTAQGVFHDLQKNVHITFEVQRRITTAEGRRYNSDMVGVTGNAACSIALRNAVFKGVPKALWAPVYEAARKVCMGDQKTHANRRSDCMQLLQKLGATPEMVLRLLDLKGIDDITLEHLRTLRGIANAIRDSETTVEKAFAPPEDETTPPRSRADAAKDALRAGAKDHPKNGAAAQAGKATAPSGPADPATGEIKGKSGYVAFYSEQLAVDELKKTATLAEHETLYGKILKDFADSGRPIPQRVEGAYGDHKLTLEQQAEQG